MRAYTKDILREIKQSLGRFLSIMMIVAIGTAFFAGVKASVPDLRKSADHYFDTQNLMDIRMMSTMGFSEEDIDAIKKVKGIQGLNATFSMDFLAEKGTSQSVVKTIAWEDLKSNDENNINQVKLVSGRYPKKANECLIEGDKIRANGYSIGDKITLKSGNDDKISDYLKTTTYTIVGTCFTPDYLSFEKGSSTIGSGKVDTFIMVPKENYISEYYTEVLITVKNAKAKNTYDDSYFEIIKPITKALKNVGKDRSVMRLKEIKKIAQEKWEEGNKEYEENKRKFETDISNAESELNIAKTTLESGQIQLENAKNDFEVQIAEAQAQIQQAQDIINTSKEQLATAKQQQQQLSTQFTTINDAITALEAQIAAGTTPELEAQLASLKGQKGQIEATLTVLNEKITIGENQIVFAQQTLQEKQTLLTNQKTQTQAMFVQKENEIVEGWNKYHQGIKELEENKTLGTTELDNAKTKLEIAQKDIDNLSNPTWYVLDRNSHYSYRDYGSVADRMDGISKIFPAFFLIVAALVCLTTMTRMVDEQRGVIGTYKALGYTKGKIAIKYLAYAFIAGIVGSTLGCLIGMHLFPSVIFTAWNLMYTLPSLVFEPQPILAIVSSVCVIGVTLMAAGFACYKDLKEVPASLMRPKAPKNGKKIMIEKINFIWSRFSFTMKVTARNIFRYKKRFFMTIIGISGCTALLLAGFGIKDSISQIVEIQYNEISQYDALIKLDNEASLKDRKATIKAIDSYKTNQDTLALTSLNASATVGKDENSITIMIPDDKNVDAFISLRTRRSHEVLTLNNKGAIISEKLAKNLDASVGDTIKVTFDDNKKYDIYVSGICENYVGHLIYMTPSYYKQLTTKNISENTVLVKMNKASASSEASLGNHFVKDKNIASITFYRGVAKTFEDTISSISFVTYVLIGAAGLLAFVVLYNLTNVNISERLREIATIKVLGFYDLEVASYVYRENIFLTLIGSLVGCLLGALLHQVIMDMAEMSDIMFGRNINFISYVYAIFITMGFSMIVNFAMYNKLRKIPMVESLKSVE